jgi:hypothetical protein
MMTLLVLENQQVAGTRAKACSWRQGGRQKILKGVSPVAWRNVSLSSDFDFTTGASPVGIEALAARCENPDFWRRFMKEDDEGGPEQ